ncbi:hypothetical protein AVEN_1183-1 [Araneus ventricosus]|uniref:Uncharacterized protein n=1 Tax=Araneus ventricosus TaxID=182803 RepID=A0A4Y2ECD5_ARAVE|nr:hypothetical protein AVEN_1183-1 [Araneus ventricosus]
MSDGGIDRLTVGQTNNNITVCCVWSYQKKRVCGGAAGRESINGPSRNQQQKKSERTNERERERERNTCLVTRLAQPFRYCLCRLMALFLPDNLLTTNEK